MNDTQDWRTSIQDIPEFIRFKSYNPQNPNIDSRQALVMYGRAIHWIAMLDMLWPDFEKLDYYRIEIAYIVINDPDHDSLPNGFYQYVARMTAMFWQLQLEKTYPKGKWEISIDDDPEMTLEVQIFSRG